MTKAKKSLNTSSAPGKTTAESVTATAKPLKSASKGLEKTARSLPKKSEKQKLLHGSIKTWAAEERPREKMQQKGITSLTNAELVAILLRTGSTNHTAIDVAKTLLKQARNDLNQLSRMNLKDFENVHGIGTAKAITLAAALELGRRRQVNAGLSIKQIRSSEDAADIFRPMLNDKEREYFCVLYLNNNHKVIHHETLSVGGLTGTIVDIRIILKTAIQHLSCALIVSHNHPSGQLKPSKQDLALTLKLNEAAELMDIALIDHLIITENDYLSFADEGLF